MAFKEIYRIFYSSVAKHGLKDDDVMDIISKAKKNNEALGISGMLIYIDRYFVQVLEGNKEKVESILYKIQGDSRHSDVKLIFGQYDDDRLFEKWSMGLKVFTNQDLDDLRQINDNENFDIKKTLEEGDHIIFEMMKHFYIHEEMNFTKFWMSTQNNIN